jgi:hypothetical protein
MLCFILIIINAIIINVWAAPFTISTTTSSISLSSYATLRTSVNYSINMTFPSNNIAAGSSTSITFSNRYNISASTLSACSFVTSSSASSYTSISCTTAYSSANNLYSITFPNVYPSAVSSQTFLGMRVFIE